MEKDWVESQIASLKAQQDQFIASANQSIGAIRALESVLAKMNEISKPELTREDKANA